MSTVTVVMHLHDAQEYVEGAIRSVLAQTYPDFELLIIDDGSTDRSNALAGAIKDPRIRLIWQGHTGSAGAWNTGFRLARGQFVAFIDATDRWSPDKLELHVRHLRNNPKLGMSYSQTNLLDFNGNATGQRSVPNLNRLTPIDFLCGLGPENGSSVVVRAEALKAIAFDSGIGRMCYFNETLRGSASWECWLRMAATTRWQNHGLGQPLAWVRASRDQTLLDTADWARALRATELFAPRIAARYGELAAALRIRRHAAKALRQKQKQTALKLYGLAVRKDFRVLVPRPVRLNTWRWSPLRLTAPVRQGVRRIGNAFRVGAAVSR